MSFCQKYQSDNIKNKKNPLQVLLSNYNNRAIKDKRASLFASRKGSMTVEAAIVLPILLCSLMGMLLWGKVLLLDQEMQTALLETGRQLARKEYILSKNDAEGSSIYTADLLFHKNKVQGNATKGMEVSGISFLGSEYKRQTKEVHLCMRYQVKLNTILLGTWKLSLKGEVTQKAWNGYAPAAGEQNGQGEEYVYVTSDGRVYHTDGQCYHLHITVHETMDVTQYYEGKTKYKPCEHCIHKGEKQTSTLYIPEEGDCYHTDPSCSGLTRTVWYIKKNEVGDLKPCSHCSGG